MFCCAACDRRRNEGGDTRQEKGVTKEKENDGFLRKPQDKGKLLLIDRRSGRFCLAVKAIRKEDKDGYKN